MTYKNLKKFIVNNSNDTKNFDLAVNLAKSKIIFVVGNTASNTADFLSSIMNECKIPYSRYINYDKLELKNRFLKLGAPISIDEICTSADRIIKRYNKSISNKALMLLMALDMLVGEEYTIIELSVEDFQEIIECVVPFTVIFTDDDSMINTVKYTDTILISPSELTIMDYISNRKNIYGASITYASKCKITKHYSSILGTFFYFYDYLYFIQSIDENKIYSAHLAIEASLLLFGATKAQIYKGLNNASLINDLKLIAICPAVFVYEGDKADFSLYHGLKIKIVTNENEISKPSEDTIFCGNSEFLDKVKQVIK